MKRSAFTLIELIFVIVIIGVLAAVAIPKYKNLKQNAEVKAVIKTTVDAASSAASAAVNHTDLEENATLQLSDIVNVTGKGWSYGNNGGTDVNGTYSYKTTAGTVSVITLDTTLRTVNYTIDCAMFVDATSKTKCISDLNVTINDSGVDLNNTINY